jgi:hypothetical protein
MPVTIARVSRRRGARPGSAHEARIEIGDESHDVEVLVADTAGRDRLWKDVVLDRAPFFAKYQDKAGRIIPVAVLTVTSP